MKTMISVLILCLLGSVVFADTTPSLEQLVLQAEKLCPKLNCRESKVLVVAMTRAQVKELGAEKRADIKTQIVKLVRELWPDTIYEGPFKGTGRIRIDKLQKVLLEGKPAAYRVTYSEKAWNMDTCPSVTHKPDVSLNDCDSGRIVESAFVNLEGTEVFRDDQNLADFLIGIR